MPFRWIIPRPRAPPLGHSSVTIQGTCETWWVHKLILIFVAALIIYLLYMFNGSACIYIKWYYVDYLSGCSKVWTMEQPTRQMFMLQISCERWLLAIIIWLKVYKYIMIITALCNGIWARQAIKFTFIQYNYCHKIKTLNGIRIQEGDKYVL